MVKVIVNLNNTDNNNNYQLPFIIIMLLSFSIVVTA